MTLVQGEIFVLVTLGTTLAERLQYLYRNLWKKYEKRDTIE